jgi:hypothetical protein
MMRFIVDSTADDNAKCEMIAMSGSSYECLLKSFRLFDPRYRGGKQQTIVRCH